MTSERPDPTTEIGVDQDVEAVEGRLLPIALASWSVSLPVAAH